MKTHPVQQSCFDESHVAKQVQAALLPHVCQECRGARIRARHKMSQGIGGDLYDFIPRSDGTYGLIVGDVTGHEVFSAIVMSLIIGAVRAVGPQATSPAEIVDLVNELLCRLNDDMRTHTLMCSLFCGIVDPAEQTMTYVNAGHPAPLALRRDGFVVGLSSTERVLGVSRRTHGPIANQDLRSIERLLVYTDGMTERFTDTGEQVGVAPLVQVLEQARHDPLEVTLDRLFEQIGPSNGQGHDDDMTAVLVEFHDDNREGAAMRNGPRMR